MVNPGRRDELEPAWHSSPRRRSRTAEVTATAFMSQKTVEANVSHVHRKLGIRSRAELGLRLAESARIW